jgi:hypothetical protein
MQTVQPDLDSPITEPEVSRAIAGINTFKAGGNDGIKGLMLKVFQELDAVPLQALTSLFNICLSAETVPPEWQEALLILLPKPGGVDSNPGDYRGISLLSIVGKVFESILCRRIQQHLKANNVFTQYQAGFRARHSTVDWVFVAHEIRSLAAESRRRLVGVFVDVKKAFDTVWHEGLWWKLHKIGINGKVWRLIQNWYKGCKSSVLWRDKMSRMYSIKQGVRQGAVLSPVLYALFINELAALFEAEKLGFKLELDLTIAILLFADDMLLLAESPQELQQMLDILHKFANEWGFEVNTNKTKSMTLNGAPLEAPVTFGGRALEAVQQYKYLGVEFTQAGSWESMVKSMLAKFATRKAALVRMGAADTKGYSIDTNRRLWRVLVFSAIKYGAEVWQPTKAQFKKLEQAQA